MSEYNQNILTCGRAMNAGSPMNVVAGQGSADMNELVQHYLEERRREDANGNERRRILEEK